MEIVANRPRSGHVDPAAAGDGLSRLRGLMGKNAGTNASNRHAGPRGMASRRIWMAGLALAAASWSAGAQNLIANPGFEDNPPPGWGNNIGYPITPWILGPGDDSNVVKVDGSQNYNYGNSGPEYDADPATGQGVEQHYLDIANGANDFYQVFVVPACGGATPGETRQANFSGWFSTRDNLAGSGGVRILEGAGLDGAVLASDNVSLPAPPSSRVAPWVQVSGVVEIASGATVSFVVSMDNNVNFDQAFLSFSSVACVTAPLTLAKSWVNASIGDAATVTVARNDVVIGTLDAVADVHDETDVLEPPIVVYGGEILSLAEAPAAGNVGRYQAELACTGGGTLVGNELTVDDSGEPILCTYTNTGAAADLRIEKRSDADPVVSGAQVVYTITVWNAGPDAADGAAVNDPAASGLDCPGAAELICAAENGAACPLPAATVADLQSVQGVAIPQLPVGGRVELRYSCAVTATGR